MERAGPRPHPSWVPQNSGRAHRQTQPLAAGAVPTQARRLSTDWDHSTLFIFFALPRPAVPGLRGRAQRGGGGPRGRDAGGHGPRRKPEPRPDLQGHPCVAFPAGLPARAVRPAALRLRRRPRPTLGGPRQERARGTPGGAGGKPRAQTSPGPAFSPQAFWARRGPGPRSPWRRKLSLDTRMADPAQTTRWKMLTPIIVCSI